MLQLFVHKHKRKRQGVRLVLESKDGSHERDDEGEGSLDGRGSPDATSASAGHGRGHGGHRGHRGSAGADGNASGRGDASVGAVSGCQGTALDSNTSMVGAAEQSVAGRITEGASGGEGLA